MLKRAAFIMFVFGLLFASTQLAWGAAAIANSERYWRGGIVPYEIDRSVADRSPILKAMDEWHKAGIIFRPRTSEHDYIVFTMQDAGETTKPDLETDQEDLGGAVSKVGRIGGRQLIVASGNVPWWRYAHEIGHELGLFHEHIRLDRDKWITINWENIAPSARHNFEIKKKRTDDIGRFDIQSIMLYKWNMNAIDATRPTITWKADPTFRRFGAPIIQALSQGDIQSIHYLYFEGGISQLRSGVQEGAHR
jgi:hypothetical protein